MIIQPSVLLVHCFGSMLHTPFEFPKLFHEGTRQVSAVTEFSDQKCSHTCARTCAAALRAFFCCAALARASSCLRFLSRSAASSTMRTWTEACLHTALLLAHEVHAYAAATEAGHYSIAPSQIYAIRMPGLSDAHCACVPDSRALHGTPQNTNTCTDQPDVAACLEASALQLHSLQAQEAPMPCTDRGVSARL